MTYKKFPICPCCFPKSVLNIRKQLLPHHVASYYPVQNTALVTSGVFVHFLHSPIFQGFVLFAILRAYGYFPLFRWFLYPHLLHVWKAGTMRSEPQKRTLLNARWYCINVLWKKHLIFKFTLHCERTKTQRKALRVRDYEVNSAVEKKIQYSCWV